VSEEKISEESNSDGGSNLSVEQLPYRADEGDGEE
jgi:hypothetical protein